MPKRTFPCGHKGFGKYCHRCEQEEKLCQKEKEEWNRSFESDIINLKNLPTKRLILKARSIIKSIQEGKPCKDLRGKKLNYDRSIISFPVDNDYRLLCRKTMDGIIPKEILSHEEYNVKKPGRSV
jgi:hypothetical protein